jgi:hypothetical protein
LRSVKAIEFLGDSPGMLNKESHRAETEHST